MNLRYKQVVAVIVCAVIIIVGVVLKNETETTSPTRLLWYASGVLVLYVVVRMLAIRRMYLRNRGKST
ncbi:hypothetical protein CMO91_02190 [Candidatus Woesearchaeota archaeon]|nr:hypothetical protein [Candidatus Woesearchaeota archaeon]